MDNYRDTGAKFARLIPGEWMEGREFTDSIKLFDHPAPAVPAFELEGRRRRRAVADLAGGVRLECDVWTDDAGRAVWVEASQTQRFAYKAKLGADGRWYEWQTDAERGQEWAAVRAVAAFDDLWIMAGGRGQRRQGGRIAPPYPP